jgi:hypothetical protein
VTRHCILQICHPKLVSKKYYSSAEYSFKGRVATMIPNLMLNYELQDLRNLSWRSESGVQFTLDISLDTITNKNPIVTWKSNNRKLSFNLNYISTLHQAFENINQFIPQKEWTYDPSVDEFTIKEILVLVV